MLSDTCGNNLSLSVAKTVHFSGCILTGHNCPQGLHCSPVKLLPTAAILLNTGPVKKNVVPISHYKQKPGKMFFLLKCGGARKGDPQSQYG